MYTCAPKYNLKPDEMYMLGILHDIGFINDDSNENNYTEYGDDLLERIGLISKKGKSFRHIIKLNNTVPDFIMDWKKASHRMRYLLYEAEMNVSSSGKIIDYDRRLQNLYEVYDEEIYEKGKAIVEWLEKNKKN